MICICSVLTKNFDRFYNQQTRWSIPMANDCTNSGRIHHLLSNADILDILSAVTIARAAFKQGEGGPCPPPLPGKLLTHPDFRNVDIP